MLTNKNKRYMDLASRIAEKSTSKFRLGCVLVKKGKVVSVGYNSMHKTHPKSPMLYKYLHCEIKALISVDKSDCYNSTAYVVRIMKDGSVGTSKPCPLCREALKLASVKSVCYIDGDCNIVQEEV